MTRISKLLLPKPQKFIVLLLSPKGSKAFCRVFPPLSFHTMTKKNFVCILSAIRAYNTEANKRKLFKKVRKNEKTKEKS